MAEDIFEPFQETPAPIAPPAAPVKPPRRKKANGATPKRQSRRATPSPQATPAPRPTPTPAAAPKRGRPKGTKVAAAKLDLASLIPAVAGLKADEANLLAKMVQALQGQSKKSRPKIVAALARLFG